jgi:outer membrane protein
MKTHPILITIFSGMLVVADATPETTPAPRHSPAIATVDMQELFKQYYRTNEAQEQINAERARIQKDNNERLVRIRDLETTITALRSQIDDPVISTSRKQSLFRDLQAQQQEAIHLDRERREFLQRRNQALNERMVQRMRGILEEIRALVAEQGRKDDYDFIFDKSGLSTSQAPILLYSKDATDITARLLEQLNRDAPDDIHATNSGSGNAPLVITPEPQR